VAERRERSWAACALVVLVALAACSDPHRDPREIANATAILTPPPHPLSVSPDGRAILLRSRSATAGSLQVAARADGVVLATYGGDRPQPPFAPAWAPDSRRIAFSVMVDTGFELRVWDWTTGHVLAPKAPRSPYIHGAQWSPGGDRLLVTIRTPPPSRRRDLYWVDPTGRVDAVLVATGIARHPIPVMSPSADRLALSYSARPGALVILDLDVRQGRGGVPRPLVEGANFRDLRWSADGGSLLAAVRDEGEEFYAIDELNAATGERRRLAQMEADLSAPAYPPGGGFRYTADLGGLHRARVCRPSECRWIGPELHGSSVAWISPAGDSALVILTQPGRPAGLYAVSLEGGGSRPVFAPLHPVSMQRRAGERIEIRSLDGLRFPIYRWESRRPRGRKPAALIHVPGGPGGQATPVWEPYIAYLVSHGVDVIYADYRGQTGSGASFEAAPGGIDGQAADVLAVYDHVLREVGIPPDRIVLYGHSTGAAVLVHAVARGRIESPLVLASLTTVNTMKIEPLDRCVLAFHGDRDSLWPPENARSQLLQVFGPAALSEPCGHYRLLPGEWHVLESPRAFAEIFAAVVAAVR
jgi:dipeptidyl aminopeptidase/acylaminoacyl peptidase